MNENLEPYLWTAFILSIVLFIVSLALLKYTLKLSDKVKVLQKYSVQPEEISWYLVEKDGIWTYSIKRPKYWFYDKEDELFSGTAKTYEGACKKAQHDLSQYYLSQAIPQIGQRDLYGRCWRRKKMFD